MINSGSTQRCSPYLRILTDDQIHEIRRAAFDVMFTAGFKGAEVSLVEGLIEELDGIETDTDNKQAELRAALFQIEDTLKPVDAVFMYKVIELIGEIADMAERVGRRLELLLSH